MNPFASPGPIKADSPLSPWSDPSHEHYYVDIDNTYVAFREFRDQIPAVRDLTRVGLIVMVTGDAGCGKTSLMNWTVHWVKRELEQSGLKPVVVDATVGASAAESTDKRMRHVCFQVHMNTNRIPEPDLAAELRNQRNDPGAYYAILSDALPDDTVAMILLPPTELLEEAVAYMALARKKIIFFGESSDDVVRRKFATERNTQPGAHVIQLQVGPLRSGDGRRFSEARTRGSRSAQALPYPELDELAAETLVQNRLHRGISIRELQRLLHGVYEEVSVSPAGQTRITYTELIDYAVRLVSSLL